MIYVVDLDDTICFPNKEFDDVNLKYAQAIPNIPMIAKLKELHSEGHTIIIHTARRMLTHNGNVAKAVMEIGELTERWLQNHGVPYAYIQYGKPYGDFYIDDKAITPQEFIKS